MADTVRNEIVRQIAADGPRTVQGLAHDVKEQCAHLDALHDHEVVTLVAEKITWLIRDGVLEIEEGGEGFDITRLGRAKVERDNAGHEWAQG